MLIDSTRGTPYNDDDDDVDNDDHDDDNDDDGDEDDDNDDHSVIHSCIHSFMHSFIRFISQSLTHALIHSLIFSLTPSVIHSIKIFAHGLGRDDALVIHALVDPPHVIVTMLQWARADSNCTNSASLIVDTLAWTDRKKSQRSATMLFSEDLQTIYITLATCRVL